MVARARAREAPTVLWVIAASLSLGAVTRVASLISHAPLVPIAEHPRWQLRRCAVRSRCTALATTCQCRLMQRSCCSCGCSNAGVARAGLAASMQHVRAPSERQIKTCRNAASDGCCLPCRYRRDHAQDGQLEKVCGLLEDAPSRAPAAGGERLPRHFDLRRSAGAQEPQGRVRQRAPGVHGRNEQPEPEAIPHPHARFTIRSVRQ